MLQRISRSGAAGLQQEQRHSAETGKRKRAENVGHRPGRLADSEVGRWSSQ